MNRRGFIGGLVGLAGVAVGNRIPQPVAVSAKPTMRLRQVLVDSKGFACASPEVEQVFINYLRAHQSLVRKISANG